MIIFLQEMTFDVRNVLTKLPKKQTKQSLFSTITFAKFALGTLQITQKITKKLHHKNRIYLHEIKEIGAAASLLGGVGGGGWWSPRALLVVAVVVVRGSRRRRRRCRR